MTEPRITPRVSNRSTLRVTPRRHASDPAPVLTLEPRIAFLTGRPATPPPCIHRIQATLSLRWLNATALPVLVGASLIGSSAHAFSWPLVAMCFVAISSLRLAIQFRLDADAHEDLCTLGHARRTASRAAVRALMVAGVAFVPIVAVTGWVGMIVATATAGAAYAYLGGLVPSSVRGALDPIASVAASIACVVITVTALGADAGTNVLIAGLQLGLLGALPLLVTALRDEAIDRAVCQHTWATLLGPQATRRNAVLAIVLAFAGAAWWVLESRWGAAALPALAIPTAIAIAHSLHHHRTGPILNVLTQPIARMQFGFGVLLVVGIAVG